MALSYARCPGEMGIIGGVAGVAVSLHVGEWLPLPWALGFGLAMGIVNAVCVFISDVRSACFDVATKVLPPKTELRQLGPYR